MSDTRILGAILAGGASTRFGSDKAQAAFGGAPLFEHVRSALTPQVSALVCCGRDWPGMPALPDRPEPALGPLGGLCAALHHAEAHGFAQVLTVPVDVLPVPENLVQILGSEGPAVLAGQFLIGLWPSALAAQLEDHLHSGKRAVRSWLDISGARFVDDRGLGLVNVNSAHDLAQLRDGPL